MEKKSLITGKTKHRPLVYLATPYRHKNKKVVKHRVEIVTKVAAHLLNLGYNVFSPITHSHPFTRYKLPGDWKFWEQVDREYLSVSWKLFVLKLNGWKKSEGVQAEIRIAKEQGISIEYLDIKHLFKH